MSLHRSALRTRALPVSATTTALPLTTATILTASAIGALVVGTLFAPSARAETATTIDRDNRTLFTWTGRVDREVYITMRGREVRTSGTDARLGNRARVNEALPRGRGDVVVRLQNGRGDVDVVEQPSQRNGYTTTIRVRDARSGADNYSLVAYWRGDDDRNDRNDRDRNDRRDDDRWDNRQGSNGRGGGWGPPAGRGNDRGNDRDNRNDRNDRNDRGGRQDNGSLRWSGRVDDVVEIRLNGRRAETITRSGVRVSNVNSNVRGDGLPNRSVNVTIDRHSGRGSIRVVQQPAAWNNYTAVIRIDDSAGGAAHYDFTASW